MAHSANKSRRGQPSARPIRRSSAKAGPGPDAQSQGLTAAVRKKRTAVEVVNLGRQETGARKRGPENPGEAFQVPLPASFLPKVGGIEVPSLGCPLNSSQDLPLALGLVILGDRWSKRDKAGEKVPKAAEAAADSPVQPSSESPMQERGSIVFLGPRKLAILTAALEDLGVSRQDGFGFKLAFGRCVSNGDRQSEFTVEGLGLAALSRYLAQWFGDNEKGDFPLQVVDEGSGELKIFISAEE